MVQEHELEKKFYSIRRQAENYRKELDIPGLKFAENELVDQLGGLYGSLKGIKQNMYNLNLWVKSITKMHDNKDSTVAFTF